MATRDVDGRGEGFYRGRGEHTLRGGNVVRTKGYPFASAETRRAQVNSVFSAIHTTSRDDPSQVLPPSHPPPCIIDPTNDSRPNAEK